MDNEWYSMGITPGVEEGFEYTQERYDVTTLDDYTKDMIKNLKEMMDDMPLNQPWRIKPKDWIRSDKPMKLPEGFEPVGGGTEEKEPAWKRAIQVITGDQSKALPPTPMPDKRLVASMPQINQQTGLTRTEEHLLSPSEQVIARRT